MGEIRRIKKPKKIPFRFFNQGIGILKFILMAPKALKFTRYGKGGSPNLCFSFRLALRGKRFEILGKLKPPFLWGFWEAGGFKKKAVFYLGPLNGAPQL